MKIAYLAVLPLLLSACGVPSGALPIAAIVVSGVDSVVFLGSGKSSGSHALSGVTARDCSLLYGITRGQFCKAREKTRSGARKDASFVVPRGRPALTEQGTATMAATQLANVQVLEPKFYDFDYETPPPVAVASTAPVKGATSLAAVDMLDASRPQWTLVLGSFANYGGAAELARKVKPEPGLITTFVDRGEIRYRVSTSPLRRDQAAGRDLNIAALNLKTVRLMPVCPVWTQKTENCIALDRRVAAQQVIQ